MAGKMRIEPETRERFPSGGRIAFDFPPSAARRRTIWIDGDTLDIAVKIAAQFMGGHMSERDVTNALFDLEWGRPKKVKET